MKYKTDIGYGQLAGLAAGDLNGDGKTDLALATGLGVDIFYQAGGTLAPRVLLQRKDAAQVEIADVIGGKRLDLVASTGSKITVFKGFAGGLARTRRSPPMPRNSNSAT